MKEKTNIIKTPTHCSVFIYTEDFEVRSIAEASLIDSYWWVNRVVVQPESERSKGIGGRLIEELKKAVAEVGGTRMVVGPGGYSNKRKEQFKFYRSHGFQDTDPAEGDGLLEVNLAGVVKR